MARRRRASRRRLGQTILTILGLLVALSMVLAYVIDAPRQRATPTPTLRSGQAPTSTPGQAPSATPLLLPTATPLPPTATPAPAAPLPSPAPRPETSPTSEALSEPLGAGDRLG